MKFVSLEEMRIHGNIHRNKRSLECNECGEKPGEKPFSCQQCEKTKKTIRVGSLNICKGLNNKEVQLLNTMENEELDIFGVSETDLSDFDEEKPFTLKGFRTYYPLKRQERNLKRMLCFVREEIEVTERKDLMSPNISSVWLEYRPENGHKILLCLNYREFNPCLH